MSLSVYTVDQAHAWDELVRTFKNYDIYYLSGYACSFQTNGDGEPLLFYHEGNRVRAINVVMKRDISKAPKLVGKVPGNTYFDFSTPYGYGGWLIEGDGKLDGLFAEYEQYCIEQGIISEFVRFHPPLNNVQLVREWLNAQCIRHTLGTNLTISGDPIATEFSRSCRKHIRQALNKGVSWRITEKPENIDNFKEIYYSTMDRNRAQEYYYFDDAYFHQCLDLLLENIIFVEAIYEEKTIAAGLYFVCNGMIHIHLSGTMSEYLYLSPAYVLRYAIAQWGIKHGYRLIHHGGGRSNAPEDTLYAFKKQFAKHTEFDFYVGKKVWSQEIYEDLNRLTGKTDTHGFFPAYRS